jgi:hypothetical protein
MASAGSIDRREVPENDPAFGVSTELPSSGFKGTVKLHLIT